MEKGFYECKHKRLANNTWVTDEDDDDDSPVTFNRAEAMSFDNSNEIYFILYQGQHKKGNTKVYVQCSWSQQKHSQSHVL